MPLPLIGRGEILPKFQQFLFVQIRDCPEIHAAIGPMHDVVALDRWNRRRFQDRSGGRPNEKVDNMFVPLKNQCRRGVAIKIIKPSASQWKSLRGEIFDRRGKIQFPVKPRFDRVLIRGNNVQRMTGHEGPDMAGNNFLRKLRPD